MKYLQVRFQSLISIRSSLSAGFDFSHALRTAVVATCKSVQLNRSLEFGHLLVQNVLWVYQNQICGAWYKGLECIEVRDANSPSLFDLNQVF